MSRRPVMVFDYFNPRTREGCDVMSRRPVMVFDYFNPRTREGCDDSIIKDDAAKAEFQSTHP